MPKSRMHYRANRRQLVGNSTETMCLLIHQKNTGDDQYTIRCSTTLPVNLRQDLYPDQFLTQYLILSKLASLTPERELQVFMPFAGDLPDNNFAAYKTEMVRWKCNGKMLLRSRAHLLTHSCMLNPSCILTSTAL